MAKTSFLSFVKSIDVPGAPLNDDDPDCEQFYPETITPARHHRLLCSVLQRVAEGDLRRVMIFWPPGSAKPVAKSANVLMGDGRRVALGDVAVGDEVIGKSGRRCRVTAVHDQGVLPTLALVTDAGRRLELEATHPVLTARGWVNAGEIAVGDQLALMAAPSLDFVVSDRDLARCALAGYICGDGSVRLSKNQYGSDAMLAAITCGDPVVADHVVKVAADAGFTGSIAQYDYKPGISTVRLTSGVREWVRSIGLAGHGSRTKFVPEFVFKCGVRGARAFLGAYLACDGSVYLKNGRNDTKTAAVDAVTTSDALADGVRSLLLRIGVDCYVRRRAVNYFRKDGSQTITNRLTMRTLHDTWRIERKLAGHWVGAKFERFATMAGRQQRIDQLYLPDRVVAIEDAGEQPCACLTVEGDNSFVADDVVVHNSTYASVCFPPWFMGRKPRSNIITLSYGGDLARKFGRRCRSIVKSPIYGDIFGTGLVADVAAADEWNLENGSTYMTNGLITGVTGNRADGLIIDDPVRGIRDADSEAFQKATYEAYINDARTRLKGYGWQLIIQTRWNPRDLSGMLLPPDYDGRSGFVTCTDGHEWFVLNLPYEAERPDDPLGRKPGELLWTEAGSILNPDDILAIKRSADPVQQRTWSALYQQRPTLGSATYFKAEWFKTYMHLPEHLRIYGASDYAVTSKGGDYTVHGVIGVDPKGDIYVVDIWRDQVTSDVSTEAFIDLVKKHRPLVWAVDKDLMTKSLGPFIRKRMGERNVFCNIDELPLGREDKAMRARSFQARAASGRVYIPQNSEWVSEWLREMLAFDKGVHDDQVDVAGLWGRILDQMIPATEPEDEPVDESADYGDDNAHDEELIP